MGLHWPPAQLTDLVSFIVGIPPDGGGRKPKHGVQSNRSNDCTGEVISVPQCEDSLPDPECPFLWAIFPPWICWGSNMKLLARQACRTGLPHSLFSVRQDLKSVDAWDGG